MDAGSGPMDACTLAELLLQHAGPLRTYLQRHIPDGLRGSIQADDILQEAWIAAYANIASFRPRGPEAFARWLMTIVTTRLASAVRMARQMKRGGGRLAVRPNPSSSLAALFERLASPEKTPSRIVSAQDAAAAVLVSLSSLPEDRRTAIRLRYLEGRSLEEVAAAMDRTIASVRSLLFQGCNQLRGLLGSVSDYLGRESAPASQSF